MKERKNIEKDKIRPIIPELLVWLQDGNWPVATEVRDILLPLDKELLPHIRSILKTNDSEWKFFLLTCLVSGLPKDTISELRHDLFDIAHNPSVSDKASEVDVAARNTLDMID